MIEFDLWTAIFSVINILVLFFFLKKFLFGRVNAMLEKRAAAVREDLDKASAAQAEADAKKAEYDKALSNADAKAQKIVEDAQKDAQTRANAIIDTAKSQAEQMLETAKENANQEREEILASLESEIADLSLEAASRVMAADMDDEKNRELVNAFLREDGLGQ